MATLTTRRVGKIADLAVERVTDKKDGFDRVVLVNATGEVELEVGEASLLAGLLHLAISPERSPHTDPIAPIKA